MNYCKRCFYPDTKPDLSFVDGICSACLAFDHRQTIDWKDRAEQFRVVAEYYKSLRCQYDCIVPVSGGKDSTYQVIRALEYGLRPLCVTATTDHVSDIGRYNLDNIAKLGVDHIEISLDKKLRRRINNFTLSEVGDISWAEHITIFTIPIRIATKLDVPLIIWGENPQNEYGGPSISQHATKLDQRWLDEFGGLNGLRLSDLSQVSSLKLVDERSLYWYTYPDLSFKTTNGIFLGQFFPWDGAQNALEASRYGFKSWHGPVEGCGYPYENLDNYQTGIHDYFKYLKFGFGRATDLVNNHIRRSYITRHEGRSIIREYDGQYPYRYLGLSLKAILDEIEMPEEKFHKVVHEFANPLLFDIMPGRIPKPKFKVPDA